MREPDKNNVHIVRHKDGYAHKCEEDQRLIFIPEAFHLGHSRINNVIERKEQEDRCAGEAHFIKAFHKSERFLLDLSPVFPGQMVTLLFGEPVFLKLRCREDDQEDGSKSEEGNEQENSRTLRIYIMMKIVVIKFIAV